MRLRKRATAEFVLPNENKTAAKVKLQSKYCGTFALKTFFYDEMLRIEYQ